MSQINTKWPLLLVQGKPVTPEQADNILLRSTGAYWFTNDRAWAAQVAGILGLDFDRDAFGGISHVSVTAWLKSVGAVDLDYLTNARIMSSWIGGPKGWCDWDGRIGCGNWNIGKWPAVEEIEEDLTAIAAAWPFLDMRVQLVDDEGDGTLCGEWRVWDGRMMETEPGPLIREPALDVEAAAMGLMLGYGRERGVSPERLASAYARLAGQ
jgi:hypothetical protein